MEKKNEEKDEEININFGKIKKKIKNLFKKEKKVKQEVEDKLKEEEEEIKIDFKKVSNFFKKNSTLFLVLIPLFVAFFFRLQPLWLPATNDYAKATVENFYKQQILNQINQEYPNLPDQNKQVLLQQKWEQFKKENKGRIKQDIKLVSEQYKDWLRNEKNHTYLIAIDPYHYLRQAKNYLDHGHVGDEKREDGWYDNHMIAPKGVKMRNSLHPLLEAYFYKFVRIFNKNADLMNTVFYLPAILSALAIIPCFFIIRKIAGNFGAFLGSLLLAVHPAFITRTVAGFVDTDPYNILFPLLIAWFFIEGFYAKKIRNKIIFGILTGLVIGLYSFAWGGWSFMFDIILAAIILYFIYLIISKFNLIKKLDKEKLVKIFKAPLTYFVSIIFSSGIFITIFTGFKAFLNAFLAPIGFMKLKAVAQTTVWPNVYTTVAELNPISLKDVINNLGLSIFSGKLLFMFALFGILLVILKKGNEKYIGYSLIWLAFITLISNILSTKIFILFTLVPIAGIVYINFTRKIDFDLKFALLLLLWFIATLYATTKGVRFTLLLVPVFSIAFGITAGITYKKLPKILQKALDIEKNIVKTVIVIVFILLIIQPVKAGYTTAKKEIPSMNDAWWQALKDIKQESSKDAIINSWWDFGHWFKYVADRAVTFDGASQNSPMAHWIGKVLLTNNERLAVGILRMLDCGSNDAFVELNKIVNYTPKTIDILNDILVLSKEEARKKLVNEYNLTEEQASKVLEKTHCNAPENYFITSEDMVGKAPVWGHFGSWDFYRAAMYQKVRGKNYNKGIKILTQEFKLDENKAKEYYYQIKNVDPNIWISPWPIYAGTTQCNRIDNETINCNGIEINIKNIEVVNTSKVFPKKLVALKEDKLIVKEYNKTNILALKDGRALDLTLIKRDSQYIALFSTNGLAESMFTRLFYLDGKGLKYFKLFGNSPYTSPFGNRIYIWKVEWPD